MSVNRKSISYLLWECILPFDFFDILAVRIQVFLFDLAAPYRNDAVGHGGQGMVVRDDDDRRMKIAAGILQKLQDRLTGRMSADWRKPKPRQMSCARS